MKESTLGSSDESSEKSRDQLVGEVEVSTLAELRECIRLTQDRVSQETKRFRRTMVLMLAATGVLRPLSKVPGVRCVMAVPRYFFDVMQSATLGDLHSTIHRCYLLGNPNLYQWPHKDGGLVDHLKPKITHDSFCKDLLLPLVRSRARVRLLDPSKKLDADGESLFEFVIYRWKKLKDEEWERVKKFLEHVGPSRRELLREVERCLADEKAVPFENRCGAIPNPQLQAMVSAYGAQEVVLDASLSRAPD